MSEQTVINRGKRLTFILLMVILVIGAAARFYKLDEKSLWSDEVATIATSMGNSIDPEAFILHGQSFDPPAPVLAAIYRDKATRSHGIGNFGSISNVLKDNVHPPLFFWRMNVWLHGFGITPTSLRLPAAFFGLLGVLAIFLLARTLNEDDPVFPLLSAALMSFSAYQIDHSQDARQYTLLVFLAIIAAWLALLIIRRDKPPVGMWILLALVLAAGLYTQYFWFVFAGFILVYLLWNCRANRKKLLTLGLCGLGVVLLFLPWLPYFQTQMTFLKSAGHYTSGLWKPLQLPEKLWRIFCEFMIPENSLGKILPLIILPLSWLLWWPKRPWKKTHVLGFILCWLGVVIGGQVLLDLIKHSHTATIRRYLLLASPAAYLLMAYALVSIGRSGYRFSKPLAIALTACMLALMLGDTAHYLFKDHTSSDEFKQAAALINRNFQPGDTVLVSKSGAMAVGMAYYLNPQTRMLGVHVQAATDLTAGSGLMKRLDPVAGNSGRLWLVFSHAAPSTERALVSWAGEQHFSEKQRAKFPGVKVVLLSRKTAPEH